MEFFTKKSGRCCCRLLLAVGAGMALNCQSGIETQDPLNDLIEYESVNQYLEAYTIWQDNLPDNPFDFPDPESLMRAIHDTLRGNSYTRYLYDVYGAAAFAKGPSSTVFLDTLTDATALLTITTFGQTTYDDFLACAPEAYLFKYIVVDLRQNRGGYLDVLDSILQAFLPGGTPFISARYREYNDTLKRFVTREYHPWSTVNGPMVAFQNKKFAVLMDGFSASASEILVSGLYEGCGAALIGSTTYGKGIGQIQVSRRTRPSMQITFLTLKGVSDRIGDYHRRGITPDTVPPGVVQEGAVLDTVYQPVFYAVKTLEPQIKPFEIRYPGEKSGAESAPGSTPLCAKVLEEEQIRSLFKR